MLYRHIVYACNGKRYELEVGVCSRGGDQSAIERMPVPKGAEQELFCRSEWEEEVWYSRLGTIRLQLKHLVINKLAGENLTKSVFPFICVLIFFF